MRAGPSGRSGAGRAEGRKGGQEGGACRLLSDAVVSAKDGRRDDSHCACIIQAQTTRWKTHGSFAGGCLQQSIFFSLCTFFPVGSSALCPGLLNRPSSSHLSSELKHVHFQTPWTDLMKVPKRNHLEFSRTISLWKRKLQATKGATRAKAHDTKP